MMDQLSAEDIGNIRDVRMMTKYVCERMDDENTLMRTMFHLELCVNTCCAERCQDPQFDSRLNFSSPLARDT